MQSPTEAAMNYSLPENNHEESDFNEEADQDAHSQAAVALSVPAHVNFYNLSLQSIQACLVLEWRKSIQACLVLEWRRSTRRWT
jgi:hypothetical protein